MSSYSPLPPSTLVSLNSFDPSPLARQPVYFPADPLAPAACAPLHAPAARMIAAPITIARSLLLMCAASFERAYAAVPGVARRKKSQRDLNRAYARIKDTP